MWIRELPVQWRAAVFEATRNIVAVVGDIDGNFSSFSSRDVATRSFPVLDVQDDD